MANLATLSFSLRFFFTAPATTDIYTLSLHDALPICRGAVTLGAFRVGRLGAGERADVLHSRSEEHTSELQSHRELVCRLLLENKKSSLSKRCVLNKSMTHWTNVAAVADPIQTTPDSA